MSVRWFVARRAVGALLATYLVLSLAFAAVALPADPNKALIQFGAGGNQTLAEQRVDAYEAARNQDRPLADRYLGWLAGMATLDWGYSYAYDRPMTDLLVERLKTTLLWVVPSVVLAMLAGVAAGWRVGRDRLGRAGVAVLVGGYLALAVPNFFVGMWGMDYLADLLGVTFEGAADGLVPVGGYRNRVLLAVGTLAATLAASQMRFARAEVRELLATDFVKVARAKGAGPRTVARHVLRNASVSLLTFFVTDVVQVLVLSVYVIEAVFGIPGVTALVFQAIPQRDVAPVMTTTLLVVVFVIGANFVEDVAYAVLDPRIDLEE